MRERERERERDVKVKVKFGFIDMTYSIVKALLHCITITQLLKNYMIDSITLHYNNFLYCRK